MNKLVIPDGGMPLHGNDFDFMQAATLEAIKGIMFPYAEDNGGYMIISGCQLSGGISINQDVSEGFVLWNYEVMYFPGATNINTLQQYGFTLDVSYAPTGADTFADLVVRNTYEVRRVALVQGLSPLPFTTTRFVDRLKALIQEPEAASYINSYYAGWAQQGQVTCRKPQHGAKHLQGAMAVGTYTTGTWTKIAALPNAAFYPEVHEIHTVVPIYGTVDGVGFVRITTNGEVFFRAIEIGDYVSIRINIAYL